MIAHRARPLALEQRPSRRQVRRARRSGVLEIGKPARSEPAALLDPAADVGERAIGVRRVEENDVEWLGRDRRGSASRRPSRPRHGRTESPAGSARDAAPRRNRPRRKRHGWRHATRASSPSAPLPAYRSRHRLPATSICSQLNSVSRTRSGVGRIASTGGKWIRRPRHAPPMMRSSNPPPGRAASFFTGFPFLRGIPGAAYASLPISHTTRELTRGQDQGDSNMVDAKTRLVALAVLAGVGLSGCELDQKDPNYPDSIAPTTFNALFNVDGGPDSVAERRVLLRLDRRHAQYPGAVQRRAVHADRHAAQHAGRLVDFGSDQHELQPVDRRLDARGFRAGGRGLPQQHHEIPGLRLPSCRRASRAR